MEEREQSRYSQAMTTHLPADAETERLARDIAQATGKPLPTIVREAIAAKAEAVGLDDVGTRKGRRELDFSALRIILDRAAARPVLDARSADEILGYNAHGLPE